MTEPPPFKPVFTLKTIAKQLGCDVSTVYKWRSLGRKQAYMNGRSYPEFTWLPSGEWGMTQEQYDTFVADLNRKP